MATSIGWLNALIGEVLFASWELLSNSHISTVRFQILIYECKGRKLLVSLPGALFAWLAVLQFLPLLFAWHQSDWELD